LDDRSFTFADLFSLLVDIVGCNGHSATVSFFLFDVEYLASVSFSFGRLTTNNNKACRPRHILLLLLLLQTMSTLFQLLNMGAYSFLLLLAVFLAPNTLASTNGMDMSTDGPMDLMSGNMLSYLHFTPGDTLWFQGWVPQSNGAMVGTCIGLFILALVDRWLAAIKSMSEVVWRKQAEIAYINSQNTRSNSKIQASESQSSIPRHSKLPTVVGVLTLRTVPPFIPAHDIARGILHAGQAALMFGFMWTAMTFQVSFILSMVIGLGVGEAVFGRYISAGSLH